MSRPEKCRRICSIPKVRRFAPVDGEPGEEIVMGYDEYETIRLIDMENLSQLACAKKMGISRSTVARIYGNARKKLADALIGGKALRIAGGDVHVCARIRPECVNIVNCCHRGNMGREKEELK